MGEIGETVSEALEHARESGINTAVAFLVALTATFMALCNVKDGNIVQNMAQIQASEVDTWSYYQAKSTKQTIAEGFVDQLTLERDISPGISPAAHETLDRKIADYASRVKRYDAEKAEIKKKAEQLQRDYDALNIHDDQFDMGEACLSIAIALFGVTALTQKRALLLVAMAFAVFGSLLGLAGFLGWSIHPDFLARIVT
jgi:hypothetical protein